MEHYQPTSQFAGAEMIGNEYGITRADVDRFGLRSQELAARAWEEKRYEREVIPVSAPGMDKEGKATGEIVRVERDEGPAQDLAREARGASAGARPEPA